MAPDPRRVRSERLTPPNGDVTDAVLHIDEAELEDDLTPVPEGYTLFTGGPEEYAFSPEASDDDENEYEESQDEGTDQNSIPNETREVFGSEESSSDNNRLDIAIDCDKIKAAMAGFTLPASSIPSWASGISDVDISSHVSKLINDIKK